MCISELSHEVLYNGKFLKLNKTEQNAYNTDTLKTSLSEALKNHLEDATENRFQALNANQLLQI